MLFNIPVEIIQGIVYYLSITLKNKNRKLTDFFLSIMAYNNDQTFEITFGKIMI